MSAVEAAAGLAAVDIVFDVDGVFNAFPPMRHRAGRPRLALDWGWGCDPIEVDVIGFPITYSTSLVDRVHSLTSRHDVSAYWLTTWCDRAPADLCPSISLNGQEWPVLGIDERRSRERGWWKFPAIRRHLEGTDHRVVWIDDDLADEKDAQEWVHKVNMETEGRLLALAPETHNGLTLGQFDSIERWIDTGRIDS